MERETSHSGNISYQMEGASFSAKDMLFKYLRYGWFIVLSVAIGLTASWLYLRYKKPVYEVSSTLLIRNDNNNRSGGAMNSQDMFSDIALFQSTTNKQNEILILSSRAMMERVVKSLGLEKSYFVVGNVKTTDIFREQPFELTTLALPDSTAAFTLKIKFSEDWSRFSINEDETEYNIGTPFDLHYGKFRIDIRSTVYRSLKFRDFIVNRLPTRDAAIRYGNNLQVKPANDQSNVLSISYIHENPLLATAVVNELMAQYNRAAIEDKNEMNRKILTFINDRLGLVESQLDSVEGRLERFRSSNEVIDLSAQSQQYFGNLSELDESLRQQQVQMQVVELLEDYLRQPANKQSLVPSTLGITDPTLIVLTSSYNELVVSRLQELQTGATVNSPVVANLDKNIEEARLRMISNLQNIKEVYRRSIASLSQKSGNLKKEIGTIPQKERSSRERLRDQEIKQNLYLYLMQKREESEIAQASTISNSRIIDTAVPVYELMSPLPFKVYGIGLILGLILPILLIYIRDLLNDRIMTRADITRSTAAPILGEIGHHDDDNFLMFPQSARSLVAEHMRILRSNLRFVLGDKYDHPTIMITSSFSGEGKSFVSTNLGATLAISGKKTVILEFDLRKPKITEGLGLRKGSGLTNYLVGHTQLDHLPQAVPTVDGLYIIPCGPVPPNPSEIILTSKVPELFRWLKENFDAIIIDTAPVGLVSDAFALSQYADSTIYVTRQRYTFKRQINFIDEIYKTKKLPHMGLLVNDVLAAGPGGYYGYGSSYYGYGYGYGQGNGYYEEKKPTMKSRLKKYFS